MQGSVRIQMKATPEKIWALVSDVTKIGLYSPETFEAEWLDGATAPAIGVRFRGHVKRNGRGPTYWANCYITECEPGSIFEFGVGEPGKAVNTWRYEITPTDAGSEVTESFQLTQTAAMRIYWALLGWARGKTNERGMLQTLERIKAEVEAPSA